MIVFGRKRRYVRQRKQLACCGVRWGGVFVEECDKEKG